MKLTHGSDYGTVCGRISERAVAITRMGATDEELRDESDINPGEGAEIAAARKLAAAWAKGDALEAWHVWPRPKGE